MHPASAAAAGSDRKSTRLNSSHMSISYAVFCLKKQKQRQAVGEDRHQHGRGRRAGAGPRRALLLGIFYFSWTCFGQGGPYAPLPSYDFIMQGLAGVMSTCCQPEGAPGA